jgi:hypothetical protein
MHLQLAGEVQDWDVAGDWFFLGRVRRIEAPFGRDRTASSKCTNPLSSINNKLLRRISHLGNLYLASWMRSR